jgi:hypothetical protein
MAISAKTAKITMATMEAVPKVLGVEEEVGVAEVVDVGDGDVAAAGAGAILGSGRKGYLHFKVRGSWGKAQDLRSKTE